MNNLMRALPPSCRVVVVIGCSWPSGPVGGVEWNQLTSLCDWNEWQFLVPQLVGLQYHIDHAGSI